jgi:hypothetical protein
VLRLAFEIPTAHMEELRDVADFGFYLAHLALSDDTYRRATYPGGLLDNGQFELDEPMDLPRLVQAARLVRPAYCVQPDWLGDRARTCAAFDEADSVLPCEVAAVAQGESAEDLARAIRYYYAKSAGVICLPFRRPRLDAIQLMQDAGDFRPEVWYHFLGLVSMEEYEKILGLRLPSASLDTSKPVKAALAGKDMREDLRGMGKLDYARVMTEDELARAAFNMAMMRKMAWDEMNP